MSLRLTALSAILVAAQFAAGPSQPSRDATAPQTGSGVIQGRLVTDGSDTPSPVRSARILVASGPTVVDPIFSDQDGRFEIAALAAGRYTLTAEKASFVRTRYGSKNDFDPPQPIEVSDGGVVQGIVVTMSRGAAISGRIADEVGDPAVGAFVMAGLLQMVGNELRITSASRPTAVTDDRGDYRIGGLAAGRYAVILRGAAEGARAGGAPPEWTSPIGWTQTFYRASENAASATPIVLSTGEERTGVDFALVPAKPARLGLSMTDASGTPLPGMINLFLPSDLPGVIAENRAVPLGPVNPRMVQTLTPGEWVAVSLSAAGKAVGHIRLSSGDDASMTLVAGAGGRLTGRVVFEGTTQPPPLSSIRLTVRGVGIDEDAPAPALSAGPVSVKADGTFELTGLAGTIAVRSAATLAGWTLRAVLSGARDLIDEPLTFSGTESVTDVQVVFSDQLGVLSGIAVNAAGQPAPGCVVTVLPERGELRWGLRQTRLERADQRGQFVISDLVPDSYLVAASLDVEVATWLSTDYRDRISGTATHVLLASREKKEVKLPCVAAP